MYTLLEELHFGKVFNRELRNLDTLKMEDLKTDPKKKPDTQKEQEDLGRRLITKFHHLYRKLKIESDQRSITADTTLKRGRRGVYQLHHLHPEGTSIISDTNEDINNL